MTTIQQFQDQVWQRIQTLATAPAPPELISPAESARFVDVLRYVFDLRHGQNAARVSATYLGYALAAPSADVTPALVGLAAAIEIANTTITYIEDKVIDDDRANQRGKAWTHVRFGLGVTIVVNSFVHFLSRRAFLDAIRLWAVEAGPDLASIEWLTDQFDNIVRDANYGQFLDVMYGSQLLRTDLDTPVTSLEDPCEYVLSDHINELRTGQFVQRSAEFGAILGGADRRSGRHETLRTAMRLVGICVQDLNDLQDFVPAPEFPGSVGKDLLLLKKTYPIVWLTANAVEFREAKALFSSIQDPTTDRDALLNQAVGMLIAHGVFDEMIRRIASRLQRAEALLASSFSGGTASASDYFAAINRRAASVAAQIHRQYKAA